MRAPAIAPGLRQPNNISRRRLSQRLPVLDIAHLGDYRRALQTSAAREAAAIRSDIAHAPEILARQKKLARQAGLPLTPSELGISPPPASQNAALDYARLAVLSKYDSQRVPAVRLLESWNRLATYSPAEVAEAAQELPRLQPELALVHRAIVKPSYFVERDWRNGESIPIGPGVATRDAARLLTAESYFKDWRSGRRLDAVRDQSRIFVAADQVRQDPIAISFMVAEALESIGTAREADFLYLGDRDPGVLRGVAAALSVRPPMDYTRGLRGDTLSAIEEQERLRYAPAARVAEEIARVKSLVDEKVTPERVSEFNHDDRRFLNQLIDLSEADYLRSMRTLYVASRLPSPRRIQASRAAGAAASAASIGRPESIFGFSDEIAVLDDLPEIQAREQARVRTVRAGAEVLLYRTEHGGFPARLQDAMANPPLDPFNGRPPGYRRTADGFVIWSVGPQTKFTPKPLKLSVSQVVFAYPAPLRMRQKSG